MSTLSRDPNGRFRILIICADGRRRTIRLGDISKDQAVYIQRQINHLRRCQFDDSDPPDRVLKWLAKCDPKLRERIARAGLITGNVEVRTDVLGLFERFQKTARYESLSESSRKHYLASVSLLIEIVGNIRLSQVTPAAADEFAERLLLPKPKGKGLAVATVKAHVVRAKALFRYAVKCRLLPQSPFEDVRTRAPGAGKKDHITDEVFNDVVRHLPDADHRLLFALGRYGALRVPSEPRLLRWSDIDWERRRMLVHSPKTARHEGRDKRWVPITAKLMPWLQEAHTVAEDNAVYCVPFLQGTADSLASGRLAKAVRAAGLEPWPRLWHSLRASCQTDWELKYPTFAVCEWCGNSAKVAHKHYLQLLDEVWQQATHETAQALGDNPVSGGTDRTANAKTG